MKSFEDKYSFYQNVFEVYCKKAAQDQKNLLMANCKEPGYLERLFKFLDSVDYSLASGGKRFRPVLTLAVCDLFGKEHSAVLPYAMAIEMVHTYSLIHDDLPCMDNDDERRGKPTNHKVYGEATALLAGDALLTDAFKIASLSKSRPESVLQSIALLSDSAGTLGMVGGQYCDLESRCSKMSFPELVEVQKKKTGALIRAAGLGAAILCEAAVEQQKNIDEFSQKLGLCFQLADDILDKDKNETNSIVGTIGLEKSRELLEKTTKESLAVLTAFQGPRFLQQLAEYNSQRLK